MKKYVELPVNKEGFMRSGTMQSALYSIMTSDAYAGELNAVISRFLVRSDKGELDYLSEAERFVRRIEHVKLDMDRRHNELRFSSHPYTENKYAYIFQDVEKKTACYSVEARVDYIQNSDGWSNVKLVFSGGIWGYDRSAGKAYFENECSLMLTAQGRLFFRYGKVQKDIRIFDFDMAKPVYLKLEFDSSIVAKYSLDGVDWEILCEEGVDCLDIEEVGLFVEPKINSFFYDFYTSNIQMFLDTERMQIATFPQLDHDDRYFSNMLEQYSLPRELIVYSKAEPIGLFMGFIEEGYYVYVRLQGRYATECVPMEHMSLLYGFDRGKGVFKRMTFGQALCFSEISFEKFLEEYHNVDDAGEMVTLYWHKGWRYPNRLNVDMVISNLEDYIRGMSSFAVTSRKQIVYMTRKPFVYGVDILETIAAHDAYMDAFIKNDTLSVMICEHYQIMLRMLEFLRHIQVMTEDDYKAHAIGFQELVWMSSLVKNMVVTSDMNSPDDVRGRLAVLLRELWKKDVAETERLICALEKQ